MKKQLLRMASLIAAMLLLAASLPVSAERPKGFDADGCMPLITEPGNCTEELIYCRGDEDLTIDEITWVDSDQGKAVRFNGIDEYFRIGYHSLQIADYTLSMWVYWEGASTAEGGSTLENQRIFSARGTYRDRQYVTLSPMETTAEGVDGLRLHMRYEASDWELQPTQAQPLEQNAWHHIAVVGTEESLCLYLDGRLVDEELTMMSLADMRPQQLYLGKGPTYGGDGYFNGLMDNVYLYKRALTGGEVATIVNNQQPTTSTATTTSPTFSNNDDSPSVSQPSNTDYSLPAIPPIVYIVSGTVAALILVLIITVNIRYAKAQKKADAPPPDKQ
ncbi:MAG: LamG domain-containing protein [Clostridia bacterium]|nr:LamG domain-containing protein [Clostridia bacterium]